MIQDLFDIPAKVCRIDFDREAEFVKFASHQVISSLLHMPPALCSRRLTGLQIKEAQAAGHACDFTLPASESRSRPSALVPLGTKVRRDDERLQVALKAANPEG